jgi:hypothetical protein
MAGGGGMPAGMQGGGPGAALNYILPRVLGDNFTPGQPFSRLPGDAMASGKGPGTPAQQSAPGPAGTPGQMQSLLGGTFGGPQTQMQPMGQGQGQYQASPAAQSQIQSLLSGTAGGFPGAGGGLGGGMTSFGKYNGALNPGIQAAMGAGGSGVPGGGNPQYGGIGALLGGPAGMVLGNMFEKNNSPIQDIAGALYQGLPVSDASWQMAGFGPGGIALGGK